MPIQATRIASRSLAVWKGPKRAAKWKDCLQCAAQPGHVVVGGWGLMVMGKVDDG